MWSICEELKEKKKKKTLTIKNVFEKFITSRLEEVKERENKKEGTIVPLPFWQ